MNIFVLDRVAGLAARYHCDKHASKMILETAQILSTVHHLHGAEDVPYRPTHKRHPCVLWAAETRANYFWLWDLGKELGNEFEFRRGKRHKSSEVIDKLRQAPEAMDRMSTVRTPFAQCMPDEFKDDDAVQAYRNYYLHAKKDIATWDWGREPPPWWPKRTALVAMNEAVNKEKA
jgi:hypothetical protein